MSDEILGLNKETHQTSSIHHNPDAGIPVERLTIDDLLPHKRTNRDWPEDFEDENGNYECKCLDCDNTFFGHKRRTVCKECYDNYIIELAFRRDKIPEKGRHFSYTEMTTVKWGDKQDKNG